MKISVRNSSLNLTHNLKKLTIMWKKTYNDTAISKEKGIFRSYGRNLDPDDPIHGQAMGVM